jgi:hypothetical protein
MKFEGAWHGLVCMRACQEEQAASQKSILFDVLAVQYTRAATVKGGEDGWMGVGGGTTV